VIYLAALLASISFAAALKVMRVVPMTARVVAVLRDALSQMQDRGLDDLEKERMLQRTSIHLMGTFAAMAARTAAVVAAGILPLVVFDMAGVVRVSEVARVFATWQALMVGTVVMTLMYLVGSSR